MATNNSSSSASTEPAERQDSATMRDYDYKPPETWWEKTRDYVLGVAPPKVITWQWKPVFIPLFYKYVSTHSANLISVLDRVCVRARAEEQAAGRNPNKVCRARRVTKYTDPNVLRALRHWIRNRRNIVRSYHPYWPILSRQVETPANEEVSTEHDEIETLIFELERVWDKIETYRGWLPDAEFGGSYVNQYLVMPHSLYSLIVTGLMLFWFGCFTNIFCLGIVYMTAFGYFVLGQGWTGVMWLACPIALVYAPIAYLLWSLAAFGALMRTYWRQFFMAVYGDTVISITALLSWITGIMIAGGIYTYNRRKGERTTQSMQMEEQYRVEQSKEHIGSFLKILGVKDIKDASFILLNGERLWNLLTKLYNKFYTDPAHHMGQEAELFCWLGDDWYLMPFRSNSTLGDLRITEGYLRLWSQQKGNYVVVSCRTFADVALPAKDGTGHLLYFWSFDRKLLTSGNFVSPVGAHCNDNVVVARGRPTRVEDKYLNQKLSDRSQEEAAEKSKQSTADYLNSLYSTKWKKSTDKGKDKSSKFICKGCEIAWTNPSVVTQHFCRFATCECDLRTCKRRVLCNACVTPFLKHEDGKDWEDHKCSDVACTCPMERCVKRVKKMKEKAEAQRKAADQAADKASGASSPSSSPHISDNEEPFETSEIGRWENDGGGDERVEQSAFCNSSGVCQAILDWIDHQRQKNGYWIAAGVAVVVALCLLLIYFKYRPRDGEDRKEQGRESRGRSDKADLVYGYFMNKKINLADVISYATQKQPNGRPLVRVTPDGLIDPGAREAFEKDLATATIVPIFRLRGTASWFHPNASSIGFEKLSKANGKNPRGEGRRLMQAAEQEFQEVQEDSVEFYRVELDPVNPEGEAKVVALAQTEAGLVPIAKNEVEEKSNQSSFFSMETLKRVKEIMTGGNEPELKALWDNEAFMQMDGRSEQARMWNFNMVRVYVQNPGAICEPYGQCVPLDVGLLVPDHFLRDLKKGKKLYTVSVAGTVYWDPYFDDVKIPIVNDLVLIPYQCMDQTRSKCYINLRKFPVATRAEYKDAHHFVWFGHYGDEDKITRHQVLREAVHEEDWTGAKPRLRVTTTWGTHGCCGAAFFASMDAAETNLRLCGEHVEGMSKEGNPPIWIAPVFQDLIPPADSPVIMQAFRRYRGSQ